MALPRKSVVGLFALHGNLLQSLTQTTLNRDIVFKQHITCLGYHYNIKTPR